MEQTALHATNCACFWPLGWCPAAMDKNRAMTNTGKTRFVPDNPMCLIALTPLKQRSLSCALSKHLKVLTGKFSLNHCDRMDVSVRGMVIVDCTNIRNMLTQLFGECQQCLLSDFL